MKKVYSKPEIMFENFAVSVSIAAGCEYTANFSKNTCAYEVTDGFGDISKIFTSSPLCDTVYNDEEYDGICYHTVADTANVFNS